MLRAFMFMWAMVDILSPFQSEEDARARAALTPAASCNLLVATVVGVMLLRVGLRWRGAAAGSPGLGSDLTLLRFLQSTHPLSLPV